MKAERWELQHKTFVIETGSVVKCVIVCDSTLISVFLLEAFSSCFCIRQEKTTLEYSCD